MDVLHRQTTPVLLLGHGSSGTSILSRLLRNHLKVGFGTESQFIVRYYRKLASYGDLREPANVRRLLSHLLQERWFERCREKFGFTTDLETLEKAVRVPTYRGVLDALFNTLAAHLKTPRWGDKTPDYLLDLPILGELFPDAQYLHLVRDGRDVALSAMGRSWGSKNIATAALEWDDAVSRIDAFTSTLRQDKFLELNYEQMLTQPGETFARLIAFLQIDDADNALAQHLAVCLPGELKRDNFQKWKTRWTPAERKQFESIACESLLRHGYEVVVHERAPAPSRWQQLYWKCDNSLRRLVSRDYWEDNVYKFKLRCRDAWQRVA